jgi:hypothetical protein
MKSNNKPFPSYEKLIPLFVANQDIRIENRKTHRQNDTELKLQRNVNAKSDGELQRTSLLSRHKYILVQTTEVRILK